MTKNRDSKESNITLWARDNPATASLIKALSDFGYKVHLRLSGSEEPTLQKRDYFYHGFDNIIYNLTCGRTPLKTI